MIQQEGFIDDEHFERERNFLFLFSGSRNKQKSSKSIHLTLALQACLTLMEAYDQTHCISIMQH